MGTVLLKAFSFIFIIILGYTLKKLHLFGPKDYQIVSKITLNITLPAAVFVNFATSELDFTLLSLVGLGFLVNVLFLLLGFFMGKGKPKGQFALYAVNTPGYNIGAFAMPFSQSFLGAAGAAATCLFDTGNAIMCTGGTYAITDMVLNRDHGGSVRSIVSKLLHSVPFVSYVIMLIVSLARIPIPKELVTFVTPIANANAFCAMLMIGLMFELDLRPEIMKPVMRIVVIRNLIAIALSLACYNLLPLPLTARQALAVIVFAPQSALSPVFTERCGGDASVSSCVTSICILTALVCMTVTLMLLHIS